MPRFSSRNGKTAVVSTSIAERLLLAGCIRPGRALRSPGFKEFQPCHSASIKGTRLPAISIKEHFMTTLTKTSIASKAVAEHDAIAMLIADHKEVKALFKKFKKLMQEEGTKEGKAALAQQVCSELKVHARIEEEIFYPAVRDAIDDEDLMDEAIVEHAGAKELIGQLEAMQPDDDLYDAKVIVLGEQIEHHATEEEEEMFPKVKKSGINTAALGAQMMEKKMALAKEMSLSEPVEESAAVSGNAKKKIGTRRRVQAGQ